MYACIFGRIIRISYTVYYTYHNVPYNPYVVYRIRTKRITISRWERRRDLKGIPFKNCLAESEGSDRFVRDGAGNIVGSEGFYQGSMHI